MFEFEKGDVVLVAFEEKKDGQNLVKRPPAIIVFGDRLRDDVWVVPLTSSQIPMSGCLQIAMHSSEGRAAGLRLDSTIDCNVVATIPKKLVVNKIGHLRAETMARVEEQIRLNGGGEA